MTISGVVPIIYGCGNCLITRAVFERLETPAFDLRFNFLGGGDTDFFVRCRQAGMKFHWAAEALITETVPQNRTSPGWLALRGLRIGAINYHIEVKAARTPGRGWGCSPRCSRCCRCRCFAPGGWR